MKTKTITTLIALVLIFAACTGEELGTGTLPALNLIIPDHPTAAGEAPEPGSHADSGIDASSTRVHWNTPSGKGQWEDGDILYITVGYFDDQLNNIATPLSLIARRDAGQWVYSNTIPMIAGATRLVIYAYYTVPYSTDDAAVNSVVLTSGTSIYTSTLTNNTIALDAFDFQCTRIIFTGLATGDEVSFKYPGTNWYLLSLLSRSSGWQIMPSLPIPTLTAGADGTITLYAIIYSENKNCYFRIGNQPAGGEWYAFNPGAFPETKSSFNGLSYTIDCTALR